MFRVFYRPKIVLLYSRLSNVVWNFWQRTTTGQLYTRVKSLDLVPFVVQLPLFRAGFSSIETVCLNRAPQIYAPHVLKSNFSGYSGHFPASLSIATPVEGPR